MMKTEHLIFNNTLFLNMKYTIIYNLLNGREGEKSFHAADEWAALEMFMEWIGNDLKFVISYIVLAKPSKHPDKL